MGDYQYGGAGRDTLEADESNLTLVLDYAASLSSATYSIEMLDGGAYFNFRVVVTGAGLQDFTRIAMNNVTLNFSWGDDLIIGSSANQEYDIDGDGIVDSGTNNDATGDDRIDGGYGTDRVIYAGDSTDYFIQYLGNGEFRVLDLVSANGNTGDDRLISVEEIEFNDGVLDLGMTWTDTDATGGTTINGLAGVVSEGANTGDAVGIDLSVAASAQLLALVPGASNIVYSLANEYNYYNGNFIFAIDPVTGVLTVANGDYLDYESAPLINGGPQRGYNILVQADAGGVKTERSFFIEVTDGNDRPENILDADSATDDYVNEGVANGTYTGVTVQATDPNGDALTYSLSDNAGGRFQINATTGAISVLDGSKLNYEASYYHTVKVRVTDINGAFTEQDFNIYLNDIAGDIPEDSDIATADAVDENAATGTYVGVTATAVSPSGLPITYSLSDNAGGRFQINAATGAITVLDGSLLDYETQSTWDVIVRASDGSSSDEQVFTIYLGDQASETWTGTSGADSFTLNRLGDWVLNGQAGADIITGNDGANVTFVGGDGNDTLTGKNGNDIFQYSGTTGGMDIVDGGDGYDIVQATANNTTIGLASAANIEEISGGAFSNVTLQLGTGNDVFDSNLIALSGIASIRAGTGHDTIIGTYGNESIFGEDGNDIIWGGYGADILNGGNGIDTLSYEGNWAGVTVNLAANTVSGGDADGDTISLFENVIGSDNNDVITGSTAANVITGGAGDDTMDGGGGNDTFRIGLYSGVDAIIGGSGTDTVLFTENDAVLALSSLATVEIFNASGITNATITGNELNNTLNFGSATMTNIAGIFGLDGNDIITGSAGNDVIIGGSGNDTLNGGNGNDLFRYDGGDEGFDALNGGGGTDTVQAASYGAVIGLTSITAIEAINGMGDTIIQGSATANTLNFSAVTLSGIAAIDGGDGNDNITGSNGDDTIYGGNGADRLTGSNGYDYLVGNAGNDIFDFNFVGESSVGSWSDIIGDFVKGQDKVDITTIDANSALAGDQNFSFIGGSAFTNVAGQLRYDNTVGDGYTHIFGDVNGDGVADFQIRLQGTYTLAATDFVL